MKYNILKTGFCIMAAAALLAGCKGGSGSFDTDKDSGIQYRFVKQTNGANKPAMGDIVNVAMVCKTDKDSVLFNSAKKGGDSLGTFKIPMRKNFNGCVEQGFAMMSVGDSAEFKVSADSLYLKEFHAPKLPPFIRPGSMVTFQIRLVKFETQKQAQEDQQQAMMKRMQEAQERKMQEPAMIAKYLSDNKITAKPTEDSLFFITREGKGGKMIKEGDSVYVIYTGMLLDNTVFDKSDHGPGHNTFGFVYSKNMQLIKGWIEALGSMHEGETARILLPSALAYGPRGQGQIIPPYSPLLFDLEIVKVKSNK
jgi:FKBP-type peptidyl-prolyl cis-trans isomerase FkpA